MKKKTKKIFQIIWVVLISLVAVSTVLWSVAANFFK
jgi:hypothetical protein